MMKKQKVLININNLDELNEYKKIGINNFLFALEGFSIGYNSFDIKDIPEDSYILINRVLDSKDVDNLKLIKNDLTKFKGIIYEDIAVYQIFKDTDIDLIWNQAHFGTNLSSINILLDRVKSAVVSNEITSKEIEDIINGVKKPVVFNTFGKNMIMYSRRTLLSNFNKYNDLEKYNDMVLGENHTNNSFLVKETEFGSAFFNNEYFNYIEFSKTLNDDNILFYLVYNLDLPVDKMISILDGEEYGNDGFLNKKTVYRMSEYTDRGVK
jgi:hypothetical protein